MLNSLQAPRFGRTPEEMGKYREASMDLHGDIMVKNMDRAGVDRAMIYVVDYSLVIEGEDTKLSIEEINRQHYEIIRSHPDRFYLAICVDPRRKNATEIKEAGIDFSSREIEVFFSKTSIRFLKLKDTL
jgi:predicted TIM-barrel fold metal-dependent hydrolase